MKPIIVRTLLAPAICVLWALSGCVTIRESGAELQRAASFSGEPFVDGAYVARGVGFRWNGNEFEEKRGDLGELFRRDRSRFGYKCDKVIFHGSHDGILTVEFLQNGQLSSSISFLDGSGLTKAAGWISVKFDRPLQEQRVELRFAVINGKLKVLELTSSLVVTGIGVPVVPLQTKSVDEYEFDRTALD